MAFSAGVPILGGPRHPRVWRRSVPNRVGIRQEIRASAPKPVLFPPDICLGLSIPDGIVAEAFVLQQPVEFLGLHWSAGERVANHGSGFLRDRGLPAAVGPLQEVVGRARALARPPDDAG